MGTEVGYHLDCLPADQQLEELPPDEQDWLCPLCRASDLYALEAVRGKKTCKSKTTGKKCVHYLCHWEGYDTDADTWEPHANVPTGSKAKALIRDYNKKLSNDKKREREESE